MSIPRTNVDASRPSKVLAFQAEPLPPSTCGVHVQARVFRRELMSPFAVGFPGHAMSAISNGIVQITGSSSPPEIRQSVVLRVIVAVKAFLSRWAGSMEGFQHQMVNQRPSNCAGVGHTHFKVSTSVHCGGAKYLPAIQSIANHVVNATDASQIADLVVGPPWDCQPFLNRHATRLQRRWCAA